eukprot:TRINITY_DN4514_c0_g1_i1.p1 TRINITY_DN4514_c0_g1~~TRINITY_DN4514_c0_g1_i1.p1  ORF type:complete len:277 (-),score=1.60 TRINITY_DN4514_c0_g1_i1:135-965(-)
MPQHQRLFRISVGLILFSICFAFIQTEFVIRATFTDPDCQILNDTAIVSYGACHIDRSPFKHLYGTYRVDLISRTQLNFTWGCESTMPWYVQCLNCTHNTKVSMGSCFPLYSRNDQHVYTTFFEPLDESFYVEVFDDDQLTCNHKIQVDNLYSPGCFKLGPYYEYFAFGMFQLHNSTNNSSSKHLAYSYNCQNTGCTEFCFYDTISTFNECIDLTNTTGYNAIIRFGSAPSGGLLKKVIYIGLGIVGFVVITAVVVIGVVFYFVRRRRVGGYSNIN